MVPSKKQFFWPGADTGNSHLVCHLKKSLYGLKQGPRAWFERFHNVVVQAGFRQSAIEPSLFLRNGNCGIVILLIYVDDLLITGSDPFVGYL